MKKLILFIVCNFICIYICTAEPMYFLLGQSNINVEFNYEHTKLVSISYQNFIALKNAVGAEWENLFLEELNDELEDEDMIFGDFPESPYLMLCHVVSISDNGTIRLDIRFINPWADCVYVDALETAVRAIAKVNRFEQWLNERGDNEEFSASYIRKKWEEWDDE